MYFTAYTDFSKEYKLKPLEFLLFSLICNFQIHNKDCYYSVTQLAEMFNVTRETINYSLKRLKEKDLIRVDEEIKLHNNRFALALNQPDVIWDKFRQLLSKIPTATDEKSDNYCREIRHNNNSNNNFNNYRYNTGAKRRRERGKEKKEYDDSFDVDEFFALACARSRQHCLLAENEQKTLNSSQ